MNTIKYIRGDLFSATTIGPHSPILAHACNPFGSWGGGVARVFASKCPEAYKLYQKHCKKSQNLLGTCFLARPGNGEPIVACLFTSDFEKSPEDIVRFTSSAIQDLANQVTSIDNLEKVENGAVKIHMPQINSGIFNVPWEHTEEVLREHPELAFWVYVLN